MELRGGALAARDQHIDAAIRVQSLKGLLPPLCLGDRQRKITVSRTLFLLHPFKLESNLVQRPIGAFLP